MILSDKDFNVCWYSSGKSIGIVKATDKKYHYTKFYIGTAEGLNEDKDIEYIAQHGMPVYEDQLIRFLGGYTRKEYEQLKEKENS